MNAALKKLLKDNNIKLYTINSEMKACIVERFNRTLKERMFRYFTNFGTEKYVDVINDLVHAYNNTYHRTIKMAPSKVNDRNESVVWKRMYNDVNDTIIKFKFNVNDYVRISTNKGVFEKGYTPNWTHEIFVIKQRLPRSPPVYIIHDLNEKLIEGIFYEQELQKVIWNENEKEYRIDHIIRRRTRNRIKECLVRWLGYSAEFDSWIPESALRRLN